MRPLIEACGITKMYHGRTNSFALRNVSLAVHEGELYALLGLNGAGKTTLTKVMLGLSHQTSGSRKLLGNNVESGGWCGKVGYLPEIFGVAPGTTARQVLNLLGRLDGLRGSDLARSVDNALVLVDLQDVGDKSTSTFSKGMMRRLGIAQALLIRPRAVFLDEPTEGLDPLAVRRMRSYLSTLKQEGVAIFMTSHILSEVERVADRVGFLQKGQLVMEGNIHALTNNGMPTLEDVFTHLMERPIHG